MCVLGDRVLLYVTHEDVYMECHNGVAKRLIVVEYILQLPSVT